MRTFAFAQLLAATLALNLHSELNIQAYDGSLDNEDKGDYCDWNIDDVVEYIDYIEKEDVKKFMECLDWEEVEEFFLTLEVKAIEEEIDDFCNYYPEVCEVVEEFIEELDTSDLEDFCDYYPEECADIDAFC